MQDNQSKLKVLLNKVPEVTIFFWIIKILCTTVGETFADFLNFNLGFGLTLTTILMGVAFFIILFFQFRTTKYVPAIYWTTVVLISVFGTLVTDNVTDGMGIPLEFSTAFFSVLLGLTFLFWYLSEKTLSIHSIFTRKRELFYWLTILFTFALGTAVGDLFSEQLGFGYFKTGITVILIIGCIFLAFKMKLDGILSFWIAYILTRPLGASLGDYLSQPKVNGGLGLGTTVTSVIFLVAILAIIVFLAVTKIDINRKIETTETNKTNVIKKNVLTQTIVTLCIFLVVGIGGYTWRSNSIVSETIDSQATLGGQLTGFVTIENDMLKNVNSNNFTAAKKGADNLETQWDSSEAKLRKINGTTWTKIDGTIDIVLASVRSSNPDVNKSKTALSNSLSVLNGANKSGSKISSSTTLSGQLTEFSTIENDMLKNINSNDFASIKQEADVLETKWDSSEPRLRKIDGTTWTKIDGTIDIVLASVRSSNHNANKCKTALNNSLSVINKANK
ncbi:hypothetical protein [Bacillus sp. FJAT-49736]|uniref:COG4705 family protein n=1 Tax=Bacillus sp. FJAT-49736 TaxID=2833582 RepID=UPI001BCA5B7E|nr:hypothetical protein [Bacillus sp. FJAT-49736]MBS4172801.1 hypothetical protein [Bacillus sp. FJAT-49736]